MKLLLVVDMQRDFIDGVLGTPEAVAIVPNVAAKVKQYADRGDPILYTKDIHFAHNYMQTQEGQKLPVPHCIYGTTGYQLHPDVYVKGNYMADKPTFGLAEIADVVYNILNDRKIDERDLEEIEVVGLCTDICVISNVMLLKASFPEVPITVISSCCAGVTPESHTNALRAMAMCQVNIVEEVF